MVEINIGTAFLTAVLGYAVVFLGIVFLMTVIAILGRAMHKKESDDNKIITVNLGSVKAPDGVEPKKVAALMAAIAEMEREA